MMDASIENASVTIVMMMMCTTIQAPKNNNIPKKLCGSTML